MFMIVLAEPKLLGIFYVELISLVTSIFLLSIEIKKMFSVIKNKTTVTLLGFLFFISIVNFCRVYGILFNKPFIRQFGSAFAGFISLLFFIAWGSMMLGLPKKVTRVEIIVVTVGIILFIIGRIYISNLLQSIGLISIISIILISMIKLIQYVFNRNPYARARQRIFILTVSFIFLTVFAGLGVILMSVGNFNLAPLMFLATIPFRIGITLSILLPKKLVNIVSKIVN